MFSQLYDDVWSRIGSLPSKHAEGVAAAFEGKSYDPVIAAAFWDDRFGTGGKLDDAIFATSAAIRRERFHGAIFPVVPLYVSSICRERCLYCNYRAANTGLQIDRIRLSDDDLRKESEFLIDEKNFRAIELVYASDPKMTTDVILRHVELVANLLEQHGGGIVGLNAEPLSENDYRRLRDAGVKFSVVWQETYDRQRYAELHPGKSRKTDFAYRLDCYDRMLAAGIDGVAMGVLSGLSDWRRDWAALMQHESYLRRAYGRGAAILGIPRLKPAKGAELQWTPFIPTDEQFVTAVALHGIFSPETRPFVSTREEWDLCVRLAASGGTLFTFNCSTIPGGYSLGRQGSQFKTGSYDVDVYESRLQAIGLHADFGWNLVSADTPA